MTLRFCEAFAPPLHSQFLPVLAMVSNAPSGASTPRFVSQNTTAEDLLKTQTVGLVNLSDFRKRRADVAELKEREAQDSARSGTQTPTVDEDGR